MKKIIQVGMTVWHSKQGNAFLEITDFTPGDPAHQHDPTIGGYKQRFGGTVAHLRHPAGNKVFDLDLSPWSHLPDDTHLNLKWVFIPQHSLYKVQP